MEVEVVNTEIEDRIIAHLGLARGIAGRAIDSRCRGADREDLVAWGVFGLVQAARRYRPAEGASFAAYAITRIRGQIIDALRARDPLTRTARRAYRAEQAVHEDLPPPYLEVSLERITEAGHEPSQPPVVASPAAARPDDPRWPAVWRALKGLSLPERRMLALSYGKGLTLREVGRELGLSESGACRLRTRSLAKVRRALAEEPEHKPIAA